MNRRYSKGRCLTLRRPGSAGSGWHRPADPGLVPLFRNALGRDLCGCVVFETGVENRAASRHADTVTAGSLQLFDDLQDLGEFRLDDGLEIAFTWVPRSHRNSSTEPGWPNPTLRSIMIPVMASRL